MIHCDVAVIGGGPAGAACAWALVRGGWDVLVLDAARFRPGEQIVRSAEPATFDGFARGARVPEAPALNAGTDLLKDLVAQMTALREGAGDDVDGDEEDAADRVRDIEPGDAPDEN